jgi:hypothetical protein
VHRGAYFPETPGPTTPTPTAAVEPSASLSPGVGAGAMEKSLPVESSGP